mmetsp:Transcript_83544/g.159365  ORF Transcript_83544/g.159365 Transcript_83544/m.159365 type:complete len:607 (-) Transcript_83544:42-1862(-)
MYPGGGHVQRRAYASRSRSRWRSVSDSRAPPPLPPPNPRGRSRCVPSAPPPPRGQQFSSSPSRSPLPPVKRDAFGRNTAARQRYGDKSSSEEPGGRESSYSRDRSPKHRKGREGRMPMGGLLPGMFPMGMGGKGMFPMLGSGDWFPGPGGERGMSRDGMPNWPASMWPGGMPWPWAGFQGAAPPFQDSRHQGSRSRGRSRGRSRSYDRRDGGESFVKCPRNVMGRVIGKQGNNINDIREQSGARIDAEDVDNDYCQFTVSGRPEAVEKAKQMINAIIDKVTMQNANAANRSAASYDTGGGDSGGDAITENLEFVPNMTGKIIGARGAKIAEVRQNSGARVQVEKLEDKCLVQITGTPDQIARAKAMIISISEEPPDAPIADDSGEVKNDFVDYGVSATGAIIGTRGAKIAEVRQHSGAKVQVEKLEDKCRVQLSGTPAQIERAKRLIHKLLEESTATSRRAEAEECLDLPATAIGRVIGKGGETIQRVQRETGAHLDVNAKSDPPTVRITGSREAICHARFLISEIVDRSGANRDDRSYSPPRGSMGYWGGPESGGPSWGPGYEPYWEQGQMPQWQQAQGPWEPRSGSKGLEDDRGKRSEIDMDEL